jgi:hypothetical protein
MNKNKIEDIEDDDDDNELLKNKTTKDKELSDYIYNEIIKSYPKSKQKKEKLQEDEHEDEHIQQEEEPIEYIAKKKGRPKVVKPPKEKKPPKPYVMTEARRQALNKGREALKARHTEYKKISAKSKLDMIIDDLLKSKDGKKELEKQIKIAKLKNGYESEEEEKPRKPKSKPKYYSDDEDEESDYEPKPKPRPKPKQQSQSKPKISIGEKQKTNMFSF